MNNWQIIKDNVRQKNHELWNTPAIDMRPIWRALAYRNYIDQPEPIVRALAFKRVLMEDKLYLYDGDLLSGSHIGWFSHKLPDAISKDEYNILLTEHQLRGQRDFWAGSDHTLADYPTLLSIGISGYINKANESLKLHTSQKEQICLQSMIITLDAFSAYILRWADAVEFTNPTLAATTRNIVLNPPQTFHEAVQLIYFTHLVFESEGRGAMALGRIDQYLYPFYINDLSKKRINRQDAVDIICHLWVKLEENGGIQNICIGGVTPDGDDATNELSYICLEATKLVQSPSTNLSARLHDDSPEEFYRACFDVIRTGVGFPAIFNDHVLIPGLLEIGIPIEIARDHCMVGCIETMLAGRQQAWSDSRYNMPLFLMNALHKLKGQTSITFDLIMKTFMDEMRISITDHCSNYNDYIAGFPPDKYPDPFLSALTRDCIGRALDINNGGAEYRRMHGIAIMGLATTSDSLAAIKKMVFDNKLFTFDEIMDAIDNDFQNNEQMRLSLINFAPKYGNDENDVDDIASLLVDWTSKECLTHYTLDDGRFVSAMAANTSNIPAGLEVGATPDGRHAFTPLSDAASPYFGRDINGPTAFLNSIAKPDYHRVLTGSVVNMKFDPTFFQGSEGEKVFISIMKVFVSKRIQELQFNFTGNDILLEAQKNPEMHRNLVVRVSGFSSYFTQLSKEVQDDVIRRRAHSLL
jgi:formate C-acetyltransferase